MFTNKACLNIYVLLSSKLWNPALHFLGPLLGHDHPQQIKLNRLAAMFVIDRCRPYNIINDEYLRRMIKCANARLTLPSDYHLRTTIVPQIHEKILGKVEAVMQQGFFQFLCWRLLTR